MRRSCPIYISLLATAILFLMPVTAHSLQSEEEVPAIVAHMRKIGRSLRQLRRAVKEPAQKEANLKLVAVMLDNAKMAREEQPLKTPELPQDQQKSFLDAFRSKIDQLIATMQQLRSALDQERFEEAAQLVKKLNALKSEGHEKFQKEE